MPGLTGLYEVLAGPAGSLAPSDHYLPNQTSSTSELPIWTETSVSYPIPFLPPSSPFPPKTNIPPPLRPIRPQNPLLPRHHLPTDRPAAPAPGQLRPPPPLLFRQLCAATRDRRRSRQPPPSPPAPDGPLPTGKSRPACEVGLRACGTGQRRERGAVRVSTADEADAEEAEGGGEGGGGGQEETGELFPALG